MNRVFAFLFAALMILALPIAAHAKPTLLANEEITIKVGDNHNIAMTKLSESHEELVQKVIKKMEQHPCMAKALSEGRQIRGSIKSRNIVKGDEVTMVIELWSNDCQ
ncbi:MAG: hypothetical protein WAP51_02465 [Candidatus Sungiibacteriota bacterium]